MIKIDKNKALNSLQESLVPDPFLIDGRTEKDWLCFLTEFGSLINFYNDTNNIEGNWSPFLLKDPVFLLASISKTNFKNLLFIYKNSCSEIQQLIQNKNNKNPNAINKLFNHITSVYKIIERWTFYMARTNEEYDLKNYILNEVKTKYSIHFWAIQAFRQYLSDLKLEAIEILPVNYTDFNSFDPIIWRENKDKNPFWEVFGYKTVDLIINLKQDNTPNYLTILTKIGDQLFHFLETVIHHSINEFEILSLKKSRYPDTTLLRSFVKTLKVQQEQLNGISQRHLDFYYKKILKETKLPATADTAFLCVELAKKNSTFTLPKETLFDAGVDVQKKPILFASQENTLLNPASIASVQTLSYKNQLFYLQTILNASSIQKDNAGNTQAWPTFGKLNSEKAPVSIGLAFASPMLLLKEGQRDITLTLEFDAIIDLSLLNGANYFLSTQKEWFPIKLDLKDPKKTELTITQSNTTVTFEIQLSPAHIAIEPFLVEIDGLKSEWPMFKILFNSIANPAVPPKINTLRIKTAVTGVKSFQLYNDYGELSTKSSFQPFGPIPLINSNFIIGNSEIASKPIDALNFKIDWDELPEDFQNYYQQYNNYLTEEKPTSLVSKLGEKITNLLHNHDTETKVSTPFNNDCFTVNFNVLQDKLWQEIKISKNPDATVFPAIDPFPTFVPVNNDPKTNFLFDIKKQNPPKKMTSDSSSLFYYNTPIEIQSATINLKNPDPSIQNKPLKYEEKAASGFLKMTLTGPEYGFGSEIYPNIVANIALLNGYTIAKKKNIKNILAPANLPFAPKIKSFSANYTASQVYNLIKPLDHYPLEYFLYTPFTNYKLFDNSIQTKPDATSTETKIGGDFNDLVKKGLPLYPSFDYTGALYIELDHLITGSTLNLYFELARNTGFAAPKDSVNYFYLTDSGWNELKILSDSTNEFRCSGIIKLSIPTDCNNSTKLMPGTNNWISIAVTGNLDSYSKTVFLKTNGFSVQRYGSDFLVDPETPTINSNSISKTYNAVPQIATITQPFSSFGGIAAEDKTKMNQRVSNTIKTKNRAITDSDYYTLITQKYNEIYSIKVVHTELQNNCTLYLVKKVENETDANAYVPIVTNCLENEIELFLQDNASPFLNIEVSNFDLEYVKISAQILLENSYQILEVTNKINNALNRYLSPWITCNSPQMELEGTLLDTQVASFIKSIEGVATVEKVSFSNYTLNSIDGAPIDCQKDKTQLSASTPTRLLVSGLKHEIIF